MTPESKVPADFVISSKREYAGVAAYLA